MASRPHRPGLKCRGRDALGTAGETAALPKPKRPFLQTWLSALNSIARSESRGRCGRGVHRTPCPERLRTPARPAWTAFWRAARATPDAADGGARTLRFRECRAIGIR